MKKPFGIIFIGWFYIFGAIILFLTLGVKQEVGINMRFGVPFLPETAVRLFVAIFSVIMAYGYFNLKKWGYWSIIIYSLVFLVISINQVNNYHSQPFIGNMIFSLIVILYTFMHRHSFYHDLMENRYIYQSQIQGQG